MADKNISEAAWTLMTSFQEANKIVAEHLLAAQKQSRNLAEDFFTEGMEVLKANQKAGEDLLVAQERSIQYTQRFFEEGMAVLKANQTAAQSLVNAQERNMQYVQHFFNNGIEVLNSQVESMNALMRDLDLQMKKQQEALQTLLHAPLDITLDLLRAPLASYQQALGLAETITKQGYQRVQEMTGQMMQATQPPSEPHNE